MTLCPFNLSTNPPLNAMTDFGANNCHGDGVTDDRAHIDANMSTAIAAGKRLYFPPATYLIADAVTLQSGASLLGIPGQSIFYQPTPAGDNNTILSGVSVEGVGVSNVTIDGLKFSTTAQDPVSGQKIYAIQGDGFTNLTIRKVYFENMWYALKIGRSDGVLSTGVVVEDFTSRNTRMGIFLTDVHDSTFARCDLEGALVTGGLDKEHCFYFQANVQDCTFTDFTLTKPADYAFHIWPDRPTANYTGRLTFTRVLADATVSGSPFVIGGDATSQCDSHHGLRPDHARRRGRGAVVCRCWLSRLNSPSTASTPMAVSISCGSTPAWWRTASTSCTAITTARRWAIPTTRHSTSPSTR